MATQNDYSFAVAGKVLIGATDLNNVRRARLSFTAETSETTRFSAGDTDEKVTRRTRRVTCELQLDMYDENGIASDMNQFAVGAASGTGQTITLQPDGAATTLKERILTPPAGHYGMNLEEKEIDYDAQTADEPPVTGTMTWVGSFASEPLETAQP